MTALSVVEDTTHCGACGRYMPLTLDEKRRVHCCDRTPPAGDVPVSIFACPTCGGYGSTRWGCWGTAERPHPHVFMRPVFEMVRELAALSRQRSPGDDTARGPRPCEPRAGCCDRKGAGVIIDRVLRRLGLVRTRIVFDAIYAVDVEQREFLRPGQCTVWGIASYLDQAIAKSREQSARTPGELPESRP